MEKRSKLLMILVTLSVFFILSPRIDVMASNVKDLKDSWYSSHYYPIHMGNSEWQMHSMRDTIYANNPPYEVLFSMPSSELARLIYEYPGLPQITSYYSTDGNYDYGGFFGFLEHESDIFYELLRRDDGIAAIIAVYQRSGITIDWFNEQTYDESELELMKWYAEVFGSQFIHLYASVFTEEEKNLAKQVVSEKNIVYRGTDYAFSEYFDTSEIECNDSDRTVGCARTVFMSEDEAKQREILFNEAINSVLSEAEEEDKTELTELVADNMKDANCNSNIEDGAIYFVIFVSAFATIIFVVRRYRRK